jgi:hypothetical protein
MHSWHTLTGRTRGAAPPSARAHRSPLISTTTAELEAAQPDQGSPFNLDLKNDKPDNIAEAIIGNVDLGRAEEIAKAILLAISIKRRAAKARGKQSQTGRRARAGTTSRAYRRTNRRAQRKAGTKKPKAG